MTDGTIKYVSYTRSMPNTPFIDLSYYEGTADGEAAVKLQERHIREYSDSHNLEIAQKYTDMEHDGECGDSAFRILLSDGMSRKFDGVVVDSINRCGSSLWQAREVLLETFQYAGIYFIVVQDGFDSTLGNEAAEEYFKGKYSEWKRNHMRTEKFSQNWRREKGQSAGKGTYRKKTDHAPYASSPLRQIAFHAETGKRLKMQTVNGDHYFTSSCYFPKKKKNSSIKRGDLEELVLDAMDAEKELAEMILEKLKNGDGKDVLQYRLSLVGSQMRQNFEKLAAAEFAEVEYTRAFENGEISEEEYRRRRNAQREALLKADKDFQEAEAVGDRLEKAFGFTNPWITLMQSWERPDVLTHSTVKKYLKKASVRDFKDVEVITKMDAWKKLLPAEWLLR